MCDSRTIRVCGTFVHVRADQAREGGGGREKEREFFIDNLLVRIHSVIEMMLVDRSYAMGV